MRYDARRNDANVTEEAKEWYFWRAHVKSINRLIEMGIIKVEGA